MPLLLNPCLSDFDLNKYICNMINGYWCSLKGARADGASFKGNVLRETV